VRLGAAAAVFARLLAPEIDSREANLKALRYRRWPHAILACPQNSLA
jgi:hypothetical protein